MLPFVTKSVAKAICNETLTEYDDDPERFDTIARAAIRAYQKHNEPEWIDIDDPLLREVTKVLSENGSALPPRLLTRAVMSAYQAVLERTKIEN